MSGVITNIRYETADTQSVFLANSSNDMAVNYLKEQKDLKIHYESDYFITYSYRVHNKYTLYKTFNSKPLVDWTKEQLRGYIRG